MAKAAHSTHSLRIIFIIFLCLQTLNSIDVNNKPPAYDVQQSKIYADLSFMAYCSNGCIQNWSCLAAQDIPLIDITEISSFWQFTIKAFIGYLTSNNQIIVAFRGIDPLNLWNDVFELNFQFVQYPDCPKCKVNADFYSTYKSISKKVQNVVGRLAKKYKEATIVTTGHSYGAALSLLSALHLKKLFPNKNIVNHNFGQPRVGNFWFAKHATRKLTSNFRVVHSRDIVPHLPPMLFFGYYHGPYEVYFQLGMTLPKVCNKSGQDSTCSNKLVLRTLSDHLFYFSHFLAESNYC